MIIALAAVTVNHGLRGGVPNGMPAGCNLLNGSARNRHRVNDIPRVFEEDPLGVGRVRRVIDLLRVGGQLDRADFSRWKHDIASSDIVLLDSAK